MQPRRIIDNNSSAIKTQIVEITWRNLSDDVLSLRLDYKNLIKKMDFSYWINICEYFLVSSKYEFHFVNWNEFGTIERFSSITSNRWFQHEHRHFIVDMQQVFCHFVEFSMHFLNLVAHNSKSWIFHEFRVHKNWEQGITKIFC